MKGKRPIYALAPNRRASNGVAVVASYQTMPATDRPFKLNGVKDGEPDRAVILCIDRATAEKLAADITHLLGEADRLGIGGQP